jgi:hypothetical protein
MEARSRVCYERAPNNGSRLPGALRHWELPLGNVPLDEVIRTLLVALQRMNA